MCLVSKKQNSDYICLVVYWDTAGKASLEYLGFSVLSYLHGRKSPALARLAFAFVVVSAISASRYTQHTTHMWLLAQVSSILQIERTQLSNQINDMFEVALPTSLIIVSESRPLSYA